KNKLELDLEEAKYLTYSLINYYQTKLTAEYEEDCEKCKFSSLSLKKRASLVSLYTYLGSIRDNNEELWEDIVKGEWKNAAEKIEAIKYPALKRRAESLNIKSDDNKCERKSNTLIVYGNNKHDNREKFEELKRFFIQYINNTNVQDNRLNFAT